MNLDKLERIAKAAQEDAFERWFVYCGNEVRSADEDGNQDRVATAAYERLATHIAAFSPDVVLGLIARIRELEHRAKHVEPVYSAAKSVHQLTSLLDTGNDGVAGEPHPLLRRLAEALDASYGKL